MLDPWIIEEIRRREEREQRRNERPAELPIYSPPGEGRPGGPVPVTPRSDEDETPRGVEIIDFRV